MIKTISIENVRGIKNVTLDLNIIPNKPSLLVAPNGFGKSSLATAFASLKTKRMDLPKEHAHLGDDSLDPKLTLTIAKGGQLLTLVADVNGNTIAGALDVHVVTSRLRAKATRRNMGKFTTATASLEISELVLVPTIPPKVQHDYALTAMRSRFGSSGKVLKNIDGLLRSPALAAGLLDLCGLMDRITGVRIKNEIDELISLLKAQPGTADEIRTWASGAVAPRLEAIDAIKALVC